MRIIPRKRSMVKEPVTPPVQNAAVPAPTVRKSEKPQPKPVKKVEKKPVVNTEIKVEEKIVQQIEMPKKRSLLEEVLEEQSALEE